MGSNVAKLSEAQQSALLFIFQNGSVPARHGILHTRTAKSLENQNLICLTPNEYGRTMWQWELTPDGKKVAQELYEVTKCP